MKVCLKSLLLLLIFPACANTAKIDAMHEVAGKNLEETEELTQEFNLDEDNDFDDKLSDLGENENDASESAQEYIIDRFEFVEKYGDNERVQYFLERYLREKQLKLLTDIMENSLDYRLYVRKAIQERKLPPELEYLPVIESGYSIKAKSRSGAMGMWQFMSNSVGKYLELSEYVDERLDPWKSTDAGLSKLEFNYSIYNDWLLALAAYNCGNGKLSKAIKKYGTSDFWELAEKGAIPRQTADYIPKLIAVAKLCSNPEQFSADIPTHREEFETLEEIRDARFFYIETQKPYLLSDISRELDLQESFLKKLNPALTKGFTPPARKYELRLPLDFEGRIENLLDGIDPLEFPFKYKVSKGDSLWSISRKYGVTVQALCDTNGIKENGVLKINQVIYIPGVKG